MASTEVADYKFTVKEGAPSKSGADDAPVWLMCEPLSSELSIVGDGGYLGIRLRPGTAVTQARDIANYLRAHIVGISHTRF